MPARTFQKVDISDIKIGVRFSAPVFFDDGENMFLAEGKTAKPYHLAAIERWNITSLLSYGHILSDDDNSSDSSDDFVEELEELEELEDLDSPEML